MKELIRSIGKEGTVHVGGLTVEVAVVDVKRSYGRDRFLVTPLSGSGEVWCENVTL